MVRLKNQLPQLKENYIPTQDTNPLSLMIFNENLDNHLKLSKKFKKYSAEKILEYLEKSTTHD